MTLEQIITNNLHLRPDGSVLRRPQDHTDLRLGHSWGVLNLEVSDDEATVVLRERLHEALPVSLRVGRVTDRLLNVDHCHLLVDAQDDDGVLPHVEFLVGFLERLVHSDSACHLRG